MSIKLFVGDCQTVLREWAADSVDACVTDPPYGLSFMGKAWDYDVPSADIWREVYRVLKPGAHLLAFFGSRTYHRGVVQIEDAGFEIRDQIMWVYGSGFPKSLDVSKAMDKAADYRILSTLRRAAVRAVEDAGLHLPGNSKHDWTKGEHAPSDRWWAEFQKWLPDLSDAERDRIEGEIVAVVAKSAGWFTRKDLYTVRSSATDAARQWEGWGTALKPAHEPIVVARKPLIGTVAENVQRHGTGAINIDASRIYADDAKGYAYSVKRTAPGATQNATGKTKFDDGTTYEGHTKDGRWPANVIHDGSEEVVALFPDSKGQQGDVRGDEPSRPGLNTYGEYGRSRASAKRGDIGSAARFFYCAKADKTDRDEGLDNIPETPVVTFQTANGTSGKASSISEGRETAYRNTHPTVKPTALMRYLIKLVTPPGGMVLDPFMGSGSTGKAAHAEGLSFAGIERDPQWINIAWRRIYHNSPLFAELAQKPEPTHADSPNHPAVPADDGDHDDPGPQLPEEAPHGSLL